jgi:hypothetical protein
VYHGAGTALSTWGGDPDCRHRWTAQTRIIDNNNGNGSTTAKLAFNTLSFSPEPTDPLILAWPAFTWRGRATRYRARLSPKSGESSVENRSRASGRAGLIALLKKAAAL